MRSPDDPRPRAGTSKPQDADVIINHSNFAMSRLHPSIPPSQGHRQLVRPSVHNLCDRAQGRGSLCRSGDAADLSPYAKGLCPKGSILGGWNLIAAEMEQVVDLIVSGKEMLCLSGPT